MENKNIIRFALICSNSQAKTFKTNLLKLIRIVLHDKYPQSSNLNEIAQNIKEQFDLEVIP